MRRERQVEGISYSIRNRGRNVVSGAIPELDITGMSYNSTTIDISVSASKGFCINSDGTKLYMVNAALDAVDEYSFGTPNDITTLTATGNSLDVSAPFSNVNSVCLSSDDKELYVTGPTADVIRQYSMTTASDLSTASYSGNEYNVTADMGATAQTRGLELADGDTKLYITNDDDDKIYRYDLSTAKDLSTASLGQSAPIVRGFNFYINPDGTKLIVSDVGTSLLYQYSLSTPHDLTTLSVDTSIDVTTPVGTLWGVHPLTDYSKVICCNQFAQLFEYE